MLGRLLSGRQVARREQLPFERADQAASFAMNFLQNLPPWQLAILIFSIRVVDVSFGTLRTISVVQGRLLLSVVLGFFEVLIWILALSQVIMGVSKNPILMVAYAGGFAVGNASGIALERMLALGTVVVRMVSARCGAKIADNLRRGGQRVTTFQGEGRDGQVTLVYITCRRRQLRAVLDQARAIEPSIFYTVEPVQQHRRIPMEVFPHTTGWRDVLKQK
jgi:uncharacterized protein YebE (UPF0316 family)